MIAGIMVDNYKLESFKKQLTENQFADFSVFPLMKNTSGIKVVLDEKRFDEFKKLVRTMEINFKLSN